MGAQQSAARDGSAPGAEALKKCYYEVLGIERHATDDESVPIFHPGKAWQELMARLQNQESVQKKSS
jgi:hypothetical protein